MNFSKVLAIGSKVGKIISSHKKGIFTTIKVVAGVGAVTWGVTHAAKTIHDIETAGDEKGEELTFKEKSSIVLKNQWPTIALGGAYLTSDILLSAGMAKEIKTVTAEKQSLIGQIAEIGNSYNMVNDIKNAMTKKVEEVSGVEVAKDVQQQAITETLIARPVGTIATPPYSASYRKIDEWNRIYLQTGDTAYRVQEFVDSITGQRIMSCIAHLRQCEEEFRGIINDQSGNGFGSVNQWYDLAGFKQCDVGNELGYRARHDYFAISFCETEVDGVAMMRIDYDNYPYWDRTLQYRGI